MRESNSFDFAFKYAKNFHIKGDRTSVFSFDKIEGKVRRQVIGGQEIMLFGEGQGELAEKVQEAIEDLAYYSDLDILIGEDLDSFSQFIASGLQTQEQGVGLEMKAIRSMAWTLWENTTRFPFWTSDRPMVLHQSVPTAEVRNSIIYFPLNPRLCVVLYGRNFQLDLVGKSIYRNLYRVLGDQENFVKQQNSLQLDNCQRYIFSNLDDFRFARKLLSR